MVQLLFPLHVIVEPAPSDAVQLLPPPHVTVLLVPVSRAQSLVPVQVDVQLEPQVPSHVDCPAQLLVHPVPHVRSQVFFVSQLNVALSGGGTAVPPSPPSAPPLAVAPSVQVPPALHVHVLAEHSQSPVHEGLGISAPELPPQPAETAQPNPIARMPAVAATRDRRSSLIGSP
jgi:hypothetical protein